MSNLRQAAQQALEALEDYRFAACFDRTLAQDAIAALRAALAEPEQEPEAVEPIAWMVYTDGGTSAYVTDNPNDLIGAYRALPLYTAPSPRKGAGMTELNSDRTVAVDREYYWRGMETCPRGVKVQLLGRGGVAVYGQYRGKEDLWMAWAPLPTLRPEDKKKWSAGK